MTNISPNATSWRYSATAAVVGVTLYTAVIYWLKPEWTLRHRLGDTAVWMAAFCIVMTIVTRRQRRQK